MLNNVSHSISFSGCSWLFPYHLGVCEGLKTRMNFDKMTFLGASSGAIVAAAMACGVDTREGLMLGIQLAKQADRRLFGPFGKMSYFVHKGLDEVLPLDACEKVKGRLRISVTRFPKLKNELLPHHEFEDREALIRAILASCYIPIYYEKPVIIKGRPYLDGGVSDNTPVLDGHTITCSPMPSMQSRVIDIYPQKEPTVRQSLFPKVVTMIELYEQGIEDGDSFCEKAATNDKRLERRHTIQPENVLV